VLRRDEWLARKLDWESYVDERAAFLEAIAACAEWDEPYAEYVTNQNAKDAAVYAVRDVIGKAEDFAKHDRAWASANSST